MYKERSSFFSWWTRTVVQWTKNGDHAASRHESEQLVNFLTAASSEIRSGLWDGQMSLKVGAVLQWQYWGRILMQVAASFSRRKIWCVQDCCKESPESTSDRGKLLHCFVHLLRLGVEAQIIHMILGLVVACDRTAIGTANAKIKSSRCRVVPLQI